MPRPHPSQSGISIGRLWGAVRRDLLTFRTLRAKFLALVIPAVLLCTVVVFGLFEIHARYQARLQLQRKLDQLIAIQSSVLAESLWAVADNQITLILKALAVDPDVKAAVVYDDVGAAIAIIGTTAGMEDEEFFAEGPITYQYDGNTEIIGALAIALTDAQLRAETRTRLLLAAGLAAILLLSVVSSALIANQRTIGIPLRRLLIGIKQGRGSDRRASSVEWHSDDEIGAVVAAFNEMLARQHAYETELHEARDELEKRVKERTSDLALASKEARHAQRQLSEAIESIPDGLSLYDADDRLVLCNSRYRDVLYGGAGERIRPGMRFDEVLRHSIELGLIPAAEKDPEAWIEQRIKRRRISREPSFQQLASGTWLRISERRTEEGGTVAVYTDITALVRKEQEAEGASRAKSQFLANMSHELRTPLNAVIGIAEMLTEDAEDLGQADFVEPLQRISRAGYHLLQVINDILDLSKIEDGRLEISYEDVDLDMLLDKVLAIVRPLAEKNHNRLEVRRPETLGHAHTDPIRLRQILLNLVNNACKFTEHGDVVLEATRTEEAGEDMLRFTVSDTGIGMSPDQLERIFVEFSQADSSTTRKFGGAGLGLAICSHLCRLLGAKITVESEPDVGSTFTLTMPAERSAPKRERQPRDGGSGQP